MINEDKITAMNFAIQYFGLERDCKENITYKIVEETADSIYNWLNTGNVCTFATGIYENKVQYIVPISSLGSAITQSKCDIFKNLIRPYLDTFFNDKIPARFLLSDLRNLVRPLHPNLSDVVEPDFKNFVEECFTQMNFVICFSSIFNDRTMITVQKRR